MSASAFLVETEACGSTSLPQPPGHLQRAGPLHLVCESKLSSEKSADVPERNDGMSPRARLRSSRRGTSQLGTGCAPLGNHPLQNRDEVGAVTRQAGIFAGIG
jgi:hypothetical protein